VVGRASVGLRPASEVAVAAEVVTEAAVAPTTATEPQVVVQSAASVDPAAAAAAMAAVDPVVGVVPDAAATVPLGGMSGDMSSGGPLCRAYCVDNPLLWAVVPQANQDYRQPAHKLKGLPATR
jgi:hypothetical protein